MSQATPATVPMASTPNLLIQGVTLYCEGEREENVRPEFELVSVSLHSPIFSTPVCGISELVGQPIQIIRVHTEASLNHHNQNATYLKNRMKKGSDLNSIFNDVGWAPKEWRMHVGNVIAVRVDKKPLNIATMQILCDFCAVRVRGVLQEVLSEGSSAEKAQKLIKQEFSMKAFRTYGDEYRTREVRNGRYFDWLSLFASADQLRGLKAEMDAAIDSA